MFEVTYQRKKRLQTFLQKYVAFSQYLNIIYNRKNYPANLEAQKGSFPFRIDFTPLRKRFVGNLSIGAGLQCHWSDIKQ